MKMIHDIALNLDFWVGGADSLRRLEMSRLAQISHAVMSERNYLEAEERLDGNWGSEQK